MEKTEIDLISQNLTAVHGDSYAAEKLKESFDKVASAQVPESLKNPFMALCLAAGKLSETLPRHEGRQAARALERLVAEATDEKPEQQGWEISLDTLTRLARKQEEAGRPLLDLMATLNPLLAERFGPYGAVNLREITEENVWDICALSDTLTEPKKYYVAQNAVSIAQGTHSKHAWFRAIYAGEAPVGFMMLYDNPEEPEYFLWRFMIAEPYHGRGFGRRAIELLIDYVKTRPGAKELLVSCGRGEGSPENFYRRLGFALDGKMYGYEMGLSLDLE